MIYGYARVSTKAQNLKRQLDKLQPICDSVYADKYTGTELTRPNFEKMLKKAKKGDTIIFDSVSRMSRDAAEGMALYEKLYSDGIELVFLNEPYCNTDIIKTATAQQLAMTGENIDIILDAVNKYLLAMAKEQVKRAFEQAQKERDDISKRVAEGIRASEKQQGIAKGTKLTTKKQTEMTEKIRKCSKDFEGNLTDKELMQMLHLARNTYYKYKKIVNDDILKKVIK